MPRPSLGPRDQLTVRPSSELRVKERAVEAGYSNVSLYVSDLMCRSLGRDDLVVGPDKPQPEDTLPLPGMSAQSMNRRGKQVDAA